MSVKTIFLKSSLNLLIFVFSVAISSDTLVIGHLGENAYQGAAYLYQGAISSIYPPLILKE